MACLLLRDEVAGNPSVHPILDVFLVEFNTAAREVLSVRRTMEAELHGQLYHGAADQHTGILRSRAGGKRPGADQAESLDHMIRLRDGSNGGPEQVGEGLSQLLEQGRARRVATRSSGDDCPVE